MSKELREAITSRLSDAYSGTEGYDKTILDPNHFARRMFRCWLDGSYLGQEHYHQNCDVVRIHYEDDKNLQRWVKMEFANYLAHEESGRWSQVASMVPRILTFCVWDDKPYSDVAPWFPNQIKLDELYAELVDDARDLVRDEMEVAA